MRPSKKTTRVLTDRGYEAIARRFRVMGEPLRLKILHQLQRGPRNVGSLVAALAVPQTSVSKHLGVLREAGLVRRRQEGSQAIYEVADPTVFELCAIVCGCIERLLDRDPLYG